MQEVSEYDKFQCTECSESSDDLCFKIDTSEISGNLSDLLSVALSPVGIALYVWGGGHGLASNVLCNVSSGIHPFSEEWVRFASKQDSNYDSNSNKMSAEKDISLITKGLDCSGYIGLVLRQFFSLSTKNDKILNHGLTKNSTWYVPMLSKIGLGTATSAKELEKIEDFNERYHPGDILGGDRSLGEGNFMGHVYMVIGTFPDKSVLLVHSSSQAVHVCGTSSLGHDDPNKVDENSMAYKYALNYMKKYAPGYLTKFPTHNGGKKQCWRSSDYLHKFSRFRWSPKILKDDISQNDASKVISCLESEGKIEISSKLIDDFMKGNSLKEKSMTYLERNGRRLAASYAANC